MVGEDGKRYLFVNGIRRIELSEDGLSTTGELEHAYDPWQYPDDWVVEMFAPEGPKFIKKDQTLGRQTLLEPIEWTEDGWFHSKGCDLSKPINKPKGGKVNTKRYSPSDDFSKNLMGIQWSFFNPEKNELNRIRFADNSITIKGKGRSPAETSPLTMIVVHRSYEAGISIEPSGKTRGGLLLYYNEKMFCGIGFSRNKMFTFTYGQEHSWMQISH